MKLLILSLLVAATTGATTFTSCAGNVSPVVCPVTKVTVSPDPPVAGQVSTVAHQDVALHWTAVVPHFAPTPPSLSRTPVSCMLLHSRHTPSSGP